MTAAVTQVDEDDGPRGPEAGDGDDPHALALCPLYPAGSEAWLVAGHQYVRALL